MTKEWEKGLKTLIWAVSAVPVSNGHFQFLHKWY